MLRQLADPRIPVDLLLYSRCQVCERREWRSHLITRISRSMNPTKAFVEVAGRRQVITAPWGIRTTGSDSSEWQMVAAETIAGTNQILWRNNIANFLHLWSLDTDWTLQSSSDADPFNTPRAWELETSFQVDGSKDGIIGALFSTI